MTYSVDLEEHKLSQLVLHHIRNIPRLQAVLEDPRKHRKLARRCIRMLKKFSTARIHQVYNTDQAYLLACCFFKTVVYHEAHKLLPQ